MKTGFLVGIGSSFLAVSLMLTVGCENKQATLWDQNCASCHDGKSVLSDKVALDKQDIVNKYSNMEQFMLSCMSTPPCMDMLKDDEELFRKVGREIGIPENNAY